MLPLQNKQLPVRTYSIAAVGDRPIPTWFFIVQQQCSKEPRTFSRTCCSAAWRWGPTGGGTPYAFFDGRRCERGTRREFKSVDFWGLRRRNGGVEWRYYLTFSRKISKNVVIVTFHCVWRRCASFPSFVASFKSVEVRQIGSFICWTIVLLRRASRTLF